MDFPDLGIGTGGEQFRPIVCRDGSDGDGGADEYRLKIRLGHARNVSSSCNDRKSKTMKGRPWATLLGSRGVRRLQTNQPGEQRIEALPVAGVQVDAADLLDQPLQLLEPQQKRVLLHQL